MLPISVIIITKNESHNISDCIKAAKQISNDVVVVDSFSTDATYELSLKENINVVQIEWKGFGYARNHAAKLALNDWILAIDADERVTKSTVISIEKALPLDENTLYGFKRMNFFLGKKMRFGRWGRDKTYRLYHKHNVSWDLTPVHEVLIGDNIEKKLLDGSINHYPVRVLSQNDEKTLRYARLNADKYYSQGKKATIIKRFLSPLSDFFQSYILLGGFLDGREGFIVCFSNAKYTWLKYRYLLEMNRDSKI